MSNECSRLRSDEKELRAHGSALRTSMGSAMKRLRYFFIVIAILGSGATAQAQQPRVYRVGVIYPGGPFSAVVEGLRDGLKELGLGKQVRLELRDSKGDLGAVKERRKHSNEIRLTLFTRFPWGWSSLQRSPRRIFRSYLLLAPIRFAASSFRILPNLEGD